MVPIDSHILTFMTLLFVFPYVCAVAIGAITERFGPVISGPASLAGFAFGIFAFSKVMTLLEAK
jgi:hypothetical protein